MVYLVGGICVLNVILWIVFFVKFNRRFSTKKIVDQTRTEINELLKDLQRNTAGSIDLINSSIERLKRINAEADQKINQLNKKLELINSDISIKKGAEQLHNQINSTIKKTQNKGYPPVNSSLSYEVKKSPQGELFSDEREEVLEVKDDVVLTPDGAALREVPVITAKVLDELGFGNRKEKSLNEKVIE